MLCASYGGPRRSPPGFAASPERAENAAGAPGRMNPYSQNLGTEDCSCKDSSDSRNNQKHPNYYLKHACSNPFQNSRPQQQAAGPICSQIKQCTCQVASLRRLLLWLLLLFPLPKNTHDLVDGVLRLLLLC